MRYFLRKYKEKINNFKPVHLCFDNDDENNNNNNDDNNENDKKLESIPETSFEKIDTPPSIKTSTRYHNHHQQQQQQQHQTTPKVSTIITRSKFKHQTTINNKSSPIVTITNTSKKIISTSTSTSLTAVTRRQQLQRQQNQQQDDIIKLQQNLFNKFNDTDTSEDEQQEITKQQKPIKSSLSSSSTATTSSSDSENEIKNLIHRGTTPPHKRFRKLRLHDTPQTPKTLFKKSTITTTATTTTTSSSSTTIPTSKTPTSRRLLKDTLNEDKRQQTPKCIFDDDLNDNDFLKVPRMRLFDYNGNKIEEPSTTVFNNIIINELSSCKIRSPVPYQPQANINPFTPNHNHENSNNLQQQQPLSTSTSISSSNSHDFVNENTFSNHLNDNGHHHQTTTTTSSSSTSSSSSNSLVLNITSIKRNRTTTSDDIVDHDEHCDDDIPKNKRLALRQCLVSRYHEEFHEVCKLGSGEFGDVFKCINRLDGCTYAIKRSKKPIAGSALEVSAWKEVCAHAVLVKHNHIVQYYSAWAEADRMLIQNEYCNGGSLAEYIENFKINGDVMNENDLKTLLLHTAKGLSYMHSLNLVHLDIKPGNIFICRHPRKPQSMIINEESGIESEIETEENVCEIITYKIGDLGHVTSTLDPRVEEGDCRYLPNEILQEQYDYLPKADIFALALTVYVCGSNSDLPKNGDEWHWIREGNLRDMPQCSDRFKKLLVQMINEKPLLRPSATTLIHHPCICPDASKNKAQLLKELNQEKFKNELLQRKVREYEQQIKVASPIKKPTTNKFTRSLSCNLLS